MKQMQFRDDLQVAFKLIEQLETKRNLLGYYLEKLKAERLEFTISADRGELAPIVITDNLTANPLQVRLMQLIETEIETFNSQLAELKRDF
jgi:hypothetical protein